MAGNRKSSMIAKRVVTQIWTSHLHQPAAPFSIFIFRGVHPTVYDKNREDPVQQDQVIREAESDKYWAPHPKTGVFGPAPHNKPLVFGNISKESVLEEKAWFRPTGLEDLEKPI